MKLDIPSITKPIDLGDYAEEMRGVVIRVWVNCPRSFRDAYWALMAEAETALEKMSAAPDGDGVRAVNEVAGRMNAWVSELWNNGMTAEEVSTLANSDTDPALYPWALNRSWALIGDHRDRSKKK